MNAQKKVVPTFRFDGYKNYWNISNLDKITNRVTRKNSNLESERPLTISAQHGLIDQREYFEKQIASRDTSGYYLIKKDEFAYNKSYSKGYPLGAIKRLDKYEDGVLSTLYIVFKPMDFMDSAFLASYYDTSCWYKEVGMYAAEGARNHGLLNISPVDFFKTRVIYPEIEEQTQIGNFFQQLDKLIELQTRAVESAETYKKAMLQKMFPQKGETEPQLRFEGFSGEWEAHALSDVAKIVGGGTPDTTIPEYWNGDINWYSPTEIGLTRFVKESTRKITDLGFQKSSAKLLPANQTVLFTSRAGIGDMAILKAAGTTNQGFQSLVVNDHNDVYFIYSMGHLIKREALRVASGSTFLEISGKALGKIKLKFPLKKEQTKIGEFFQALDERIEVETKKLNHYESLKKAMLQRMFV